MGDGGGTGRRRQGATAGRGADVGQGGRSGSGAARKAGGGAARGAGSGAVQGSRGEVGRGDSEGSGAAGWGDATREITNDQMLAIAGMRWLSEAGSMKQTSWVQFPVKAHGAQSSPS